MENKKNKEAQSTESRVAFLILEDGTVFQGKGFGATGEIIGEVVFTTAMTGYQETLTDPSFYGQLITQTFPLMGNYGLNEEDVESHKCWAKGYIVREWCEYPSNFRSEWDLNTYLKKQGVVGICGIDTRALTKRLRKCGVMNGAIVGEMPQSISAFTEKLKAFEIKDTAQAVSIKEITKGDSGQGDYHVVLYDYGYKHNILRSLQDRGCQVTVVPHSTPAEVVKALDPDGIMLSNGPGNPADHQEEISIIRALKKENIPLFGICLGHQLLALASGATTEKLKYGHRGANQPVVDKTKDRVFITSQNHGYAVVGESLDPAVGTVTHYNANDGSCEGISYTGGKSFSVQFHPEACAGPQDTQYLFDQFIANMKVK